METKIENRKKLVENRIKNLYYPDDNYPKLASNFSPVFTAKAICILFLLEKIHLNGSTCKTSLAKNYISLGKSSETPEEKKYVKKIAKTITRKLYRYPAALCEEDIVISQAA